LLALPGKQPGHTCNRGQHQGRRQPDGADPYRTARLLGFAPLRGFPLRLLGLGLAHQLLAFGQSLAFLALAARVVLLTGADVVEKQRRWGWRVAGLPREPALGRRNAVAEQQPAVAAPPLVPLAGALQQACAFPQPVEVGLQRLDEADEPGAEARARVVRLVVE